MNAMLRKLRDAASPSQLGAFDVGVEELGRDLIRKRVEWVSGQHAEIPEPVRLASMATEIVSVGLRALHDRAQNAELQEAREKRKRTQEYERGLLASGEAVARLIAFAAGMATASPRRARAALSMLAGGTKAAVAAEMGISYEAVRQHWERFIRRAIRAGVIGPP